MEVRQLTHGDYDTLSKWWTWWRWPIIPNNCLPENGIGGFMVSADGVAVVAGFLYFTNSTMAFCEWLISNPEIKDKEVREEAIVMLINHISEKAKKGGATVIYTYLRNDHLESKYIKAGYQVTTRGGNELVKILQ